jgi:hypothetical protein
VHPQEQHKFDVPRDRKLSQRQCVAATNEPLLGLVKTLRPALGDEVLAFGPQPALQDGAARGVSKTHSAASRSGDARRCGPQLTMKDNHLPCNILQHPCASGTPTAFESHDAMRFPR